MEAVTFKNQIYFKKILFLAHLFIHLGNEAQLTGYKEYLTNDVTNESKWLLWQHYIGSAQIIRNANPFPSELKRKLQTIHTSNHTPKRLIPKEK